MTPSETDVAWAAGLFEGEGTITLSGKSKSPRLKLSMVDADVVRKFGRVVGGGCYSIQRFKNPEYKQQLSWYTAKKSEVARILELLMPHFGERRLNRASQVLARSIDAPHEGWDGARVSELPRDVYA